MPTTTTAATKWGNEHGQASAKEGQIPPATGLRRQFLAPLNIQGLSLQAANAAEHRRDGDHFLQLILPSHAYNWDNGGGEPSI